MQGAKNLLTDPSFEQQDIDVWKNVGKGFITSNEETYDGSIAAKIAAPVGIYGYPARFELESRLRAALFRFVPMSKFGSLGMDLHPANFFVKGREMLYFGY